jgi:hypothetical protein
MDNNEQDQGSNHLRYYIAYLIAFLCLLTYSLICTNVISSHHEALHVHYSGFTSTFRPLLG